MTLAISMLNNIFPLHTNTQNYHLKYPNVLHQMSYIYSHFKKSLMLKNAIILAISKHDSLRPLYMHLVRWFANKCT